MKLFEVITKFLYHSTSDKNAIQALRDGELRRSYDGIDDEGNEIVFVSTTTNPKLLFFGGWPDTGNIQFVFNPNALVAMGYELQPIKRWEEVRIILPDGKMSLPINNRIVDHISIEDTDLRYFKSWAQDIDHDTRSGQEHYTRLKRNELSPKGEFAGNENPFGIIKTLAARRKIPIVDNRKPRR